MRAWVVGLICCSAVAALPCTLAAQRGELALIGAFVQSPDVEFDRVYRTGLIGTPQYARQLGERQSDLALAAAATFAIRGHVFAELGIMHHGVERTVSGTAVGDPGGAFVNTNRFRGGITSFWVGPSYRVVDRERLAVSLVAAPTVILMTGDAFQNQIVGQNAPSSSTTLGVLAGLRGRLWLTERTGVQLGLDNLLWTFPLMPNATDDTPFAPQSSRSTPRQHDLRVQLGIALRLD